MTEPEESDDFDDEGTEQLGDAGKKALDAMKAKLKAERARIKELEPLAVKAREADEAAKTELQKATEARAAIEKERDEARLALLKRDIADEAGLPKSWAKRLTGSTKEELEADAKEMAKDLAPKIGTATGRPVRELRPGALPAGDSPAPANPGAAMDLQIREAVRGRSSRRIT